MHRLHFRNTLNTNRIGCIAPFCFKFKFLKFNQFSPQTWYFSIKLQQLVSLIFAFFIIFSHCFKFTQFWYLFNHFCLQIGKFYCLRIVITLQFLDCLLKMFLHTRLSNNYSFKLLHQLPESYVLSLTFCRSTPDFFRVHCVFVYFYL